LLQTLQELQIGGTRAAAIFCRWGGDETFPVGYRAFSGKVESGFPFENATNARKLEHIQFPKKLNVL